MPFLFCLLWAHVDPLSFREYRVDVIEFNQVVTADEFGRVLDVKLSQLIFWDWDKTAGEFVVRDWRAWQGKKARPRFDHKRKCWVLIFEDRGKWLTINSTSYVKTVTDFDPEIENRKRLTPDRRRRL